MDTKWKRLIDNDKENYGISQSDMYQMFAYSKKYDTREIWLLYPMNEEMRGHKPIRFDSVRPVTNEVETTVRLFFVDVANMEESLGELREKIEGRPFYV